MKPGIAAAILAVVVAGGVVTVAMLPKGVQLSASQLCAMAAHDTQLAPIVESRMACCYLYESPKCSGVCRPSHEGWRCYGEGIGGELGLCDPADTAAKVQPMPCDAGRRPRKVGDDEFAKAVDAAEARLKSDK